MPTDRPPLRLADGQPIPPGPGVYLLHLVDRATGRTARYRHAGHYVGYAQDLPTRLREELAGTAKAANLLRVAYAAGLAAVVDHVRPGNRGDERRLKNRGGAARFCTRCRAEHPTTRGTQPQHHHPHRTPDTPAPVTAFLRLNPAAARPARAPAAVQYARVRGREESAVLTDRVRLALEDDNHSLQQNRAATVIRRARLARHRARQQRLQQRAELAAEQQRPARLAERTRQHPAPFTRAARLSLARQARAARRHREVATLER